MQDQPILKTDRLILRPFRLADASDVQRLAGDRAVAATTLPIPHPYEDGMAEDWIRSQKDKDSEIVFAITHAEESYLIGAIGLNVDNDFEHAELGYWIGKSYWRQGYATEAARAVLRYGFDMLSLHRIHSHHFAGNPASGRVMQKIGMTREGLLRQHIKKWDQYEDVVMYGILRNDFK
jgi:RimJ/RimL family protein N-acetyltransferase